MELEEIKEYTSSQLRRAYEDICEEYAKRMCERFGIDYDTCFWVCDEVGTVFCADNIDFSLGMDDIIFIVEKRLSWDDFWEYWSYNMEETLKYKLNSFPINMKSWFNGYRPENYS
jgi:hypothetical protein